MSQRVGVGAGGIVFFCNQKVPMDLAGLPGEGGAPGICVLHRGFSAASGLPWPIQLFGGRMAGVPGHRHRT